MWRNKLTMYLEGRKKKASIAHLFPPRSHVCREFYENMLPCICGPLQEMDGFQSMIYHGIGERKAVMTLVSAISECMQNKLALPEHHSPFFDEEMDQGTLILVPILKTTEALDWKKDEGYNVLVIADSSKTYRFCDMDHSTLPLTASMEDIEVATQFVTKCMLSLGYSLSNHDFEPLSDPTRENRFDRPKKAQEANTDFQAKVEAMSILKRFITDSGQKVLTPTLKMKHSQDGRVDDEEVPLLLKINFGDIPHFRCPHPMLLGFKAGVCLHKYAATKDPSGYKSADVNLDVKEYVKTRGSMMLLPACDGLGGTSDSDWEEDENSASHSPGTSEKFRPCVPMSVPVEITVPVEIPRVVTPEK